jgi:hypothetical protein
VGVIDSTMEETMFKQFLIGAALIAMATGTANAQYREAVLQKIEAPGSSFDIVVAMAKPGGWTFDPRTQRDAYLGGVVHLGDTLVHPLTEDFLRTFTNIALLPHPACSFHAPSKNGEAGTPVVVYVVPKSE